MKRRTFEMLYNKKLIQKQKSERFHNYITWFNFVFIENVYFTEKRKSLKKTSFTRRNNVAKMSIDNPTSFKRRNYAKNIRVDITTSFRRRNYVEKIRVVRTTSIRRRY